MERYIGFEPIPKPWKGLMLPLHQYRMKRNAVCRKLLRLRYSPFTSTEGKWTSFLNWLIASELRSTTPLVIVEISCALTGYCCITTFRVTRSDLVRQATLLIGWTREYLYGIAMFVNKFLLCLIHTDYVPTEVNTEPKDLTLFFWFYLPWS